MRTYGIGDIHGCADQLMCLLGSIRRHSAGRPRRLVFVGDYVDRGPNSTGVLRMLRDLQRAEPDEVTCLMGNHEQMMLTAYQQGLGMEIWHENGGDTTLASFGVEDPEDLPHEALAWISGLPTVYEDDLRYFVHAGFRPGRPGIDPDEQARLWIREPFLSADYDFGKHVVHGHSPLIDGKPDVRQNRTNIDTACVFGGKLTAGVFTALWSKCTKGVSGPPIPVVSQFEFNGYRPGEGRSGLVFQTKIRAQLQKHSLGLTEIDQSAILAGKKFPRK